MSNVYGGVGRRKLYAHYEDSFWFGWKEDRRRYLNKSSFRVGKAVQEIWDDLMDRRGIRQELENCGESIQEEIKVMMLEKIYNIFKDIG